MCRETVRTNSVRRTRLKCSRMRGRMNKNRMPPNASKPSFWRRKVVLLQNRNRWIFFTKFVHRFFLNCWKAKFKQNCHFFILNIGLPLKDDVNSSIFRMLILTFTSIVSLNLNPQVTLNEKPDLNKSTEKDVLDQTKLSRVFLN